MTDTMPTMEDLAGHTPQPELRRGFVAQTLRPVLGRLGIISSAPDIDQFIETQEAPPSSTGSEERGSPLAEGASTLAQLAVGRRAYVTPWTMKVTPRGYCLLNGNQRSERLPSGTVRMLVVRTAEGYEVSVPKDYKYKPLDYKIKAEGLVPVSKVSQSGY